MFRAIFRFGERKLISTLFSLSGAKVPGREFQGAKVLGSESFTLSLLGVKV